MSKRRAPVLSIGDTEIHTWFERDRASVELREKKTGRTIAEWWDEDVRQAVEDGFLSPKNWHRSAFDYAAHLGLLVPAGRNPGARRNWKAWDHKVAARKAGARQDDQLAQALRSKEGSFTERGHLDKANFEHGQIAAHKAAMEPAPKSNPRPCYNPAKPDQFGPRVRFNWGFHDAAWELGRGIYRRYIDGPFPKDAPPMTYVSYKHDPAYYWGHRFGKEAFKEGTYKNNSEPTWIHFMDIYPDELKKMGVTRTGPTAYKYQELVDGKVRWRKESQPISRNASPSWHAFQAAEAEAQAQMIGGAPDKPSRQYLLGVQKAHEKSIAEAKRNPVVIGAPEVEHVTVVKDSQPHKALLSSGWTLARVEGDKAIMLPPKGNPGAGTDNTARAIVRAAQLMAQGMTSSDAIAQAAKEFRVDWDSIWEGLLAKHKKAAGKPGINPGTDMASLMATNEFKKGVRLYEQIHGCPPKSVRRVVLPMGGKQITGRAVVVSLGKAPAESYEPRAGSRKHGRIWVHPYDHKPEKVVTADGRLIMTLPGTHAVKPGPDGEAWIHG